MGVSIRFGAAVFLLFLLSLISCKSLKYNDRLIDYDYIESDKQGYQIVGDYQQIQFVDGGFIRIMPAYFREFGSKSQSLIVRISIDKKYGFRNLGKVVSKEFGELNAINHEWAKHYDGKDDILYALSLKEIDFIARKSKILKDTITVVIGNKKLLFTPTK